LRTPEASESLLHIQALSNLLQGALLSKISCVQPNLTLEKDLEPVIEQIDELYRLGVVGLAKCLQESFVIKLALADLAPLRLREEADKLIRLDQEFSSSTSDDLEGFGFTAVPLLLRAQMLDDFRIIGAVISQHKQKANETDAIGRTALHVALDHIHTSSWISTGYSRGYSRTQKEYQVVDSLLKWGVPIDAQDIFRRTALHVACFNNFGIKVIQLLLEQHGLNIDAQDAVGRTAFSWAVKKGNEATAKLLLATGVVNVNSKDKIGRSPLSFAAETGDRNMVKTLLARDDIDPEMIDIWDLSPLAFALKN
jgi:hypothetical protein